MIEFITNAWPGLVCLVALFGSIAFAKLILERLSNMETANTHKKNNLEQSLRAGIYAREKHNNPESEKVLDRVVKEATDFMEKESKK